jgi:archaellum biogenesis ATPase FlaH
VPLNDRAMILTKIKDRIKNADKRVIYFEGLDAMKFGARFDDIMKFLQQITETVSLYKAVAIFSIDLERLTEQERAAIEGELERIEIGHQNLRSS